MSLPIEQYLPEILSLAFHHKTLLIKAAPGAGKSTRVPKALLDNGAQGILVLQPRRLAAKMMARFVSEEIGEGVGEVVGYQVRQDSRVGPRTRLCFVTEGLFLRRVLADPHLKGVDWVILDEFHERHLNTDLAFAVVGALRKSTRPDLGLIVMSATLDVGLLQGALQGLVVVEVPGVNYPLDIVYQNPLHPRLGELSLEKQVVTALNTLLAHPSCPGHVLVFLPGEREIQHCLDMCQSLVQDGVKLLPLKADSPPHVQDQVFASTSQRKIIFSTNVAETSVTIPGITGVVDGGLARVAGYSGWSGLPHLKVKPVSQASCTQRAGRAGRTGPGVVVRLFTEANWRQRPAFELPEIQRSDLSQTVLEALALQENLRLQSPLFDFLVEPPPEKSWEAALELLRVLGAVDENNSLTPLGSAMASYPLHPRLSRVMVSGAKDTFEAKSQLALAVALVQEGGVFKRNGRAPDDGPSDLDFHRDALIHGKYTALYDPSAGKRVLSSWKQLCRVALGIEPKAPPQGWFVHHITHHLLKGFADRVAQMRGDRRLALCQGGSARLSPLSGVTTDRFVLALDATEIPGKTGEEAIVITMAAAVDEVELLDASPQCLTDEGAWQWDEGAKGVKWCQSLKYGHLILESRRQPPPPYENLNALDRDTIRKLLKPKVHSLLLEAMGELWPTTLDGQWWYMAQRLQALGESAPEGSFPWENFLDGLTHGVTQLSQIPQDLRAYVVNFIPERWLQAWVRMSPTLVRCVNGRSFEIHYRPGQPPWVEGAIQDFFGCQETPQLLGQPLVIHLLAPNKQTVQITTSLETFWQRDYPMVKKDLGRKYPRHEWPLDPAMAKPPERRTRRKG